MRRQEFTIAVTELAREEAFRYARHTSADRLEWRPLGTGQSVLSMARELAKTPDWAYWVLTDAKPADPERAVAEQKAEMAAWTTIDACEAACRDKLARLYELYRSYSDEDLAQSKWLPFNGGRDHTYAELLDYPRWNFTYHLGQIAYIQTLYGAGNGPNRPLRSADRPAIITDEVLHKTSGKTMRLQDITIDATRAAMEEAFAYAKAVPEDKLNWKPLDAGRSAMELSQELAKCPDWAYDIVVNGGMDGSEASGSQDEMASWTTVAACEAACKEKLGRYFELLKSLPDERLNETVDLPFGPGGSMKTFSMPELMDYPRWNATYHLGQIGYIQTLYGDRDMH